MKHFYIGDIAANLVFALFLAACLFLSAGTFNYWQAWVFLAVFEVCSQAFGVYLLTHDRKLLERRMKVGPLAEKEPNQKIIASLLVLAFIAMFMFPAFDHRFGWSPVAPVVSVIANTMIVLSFLLFFVVMKSNSYAASTI